MKPPIPIMLRMCLSLAWHEHVTNTFSKCVDLLNRSLQLKAVPKHGLACTDSAAGTCRFNI